MFKFVKKYTTEEENNIKIDCHILQREFNKSIKGLVMKVNSIDLYINKFNVIMEMSHLESKIIYYYSFRSEVDIHDETVIYCEIDREKKQNNTLGIAMANL